jgi:hypothetical protein
MSKTNLDRLLENAVAKALGLNAPHKGVNRLMVPRRGETTKRAA